MTSIAIIYYHRERELAEKLTPYLDKYGYTPQKAPLGFTVGSKEWKKRVDEDFDSASAFIALVTRKALDNFWFLWRLNLAVLISIQNGRPLLIVRTEKIEEGYFAQKLRKFDSELPYLGAHFFAYQMPEWVMEDGISDNKTIEEIIDHLNRNRPKSVFISYSHKDEDFAKKLAKDLMHNGIRIWRDKDNIPPGTSWDTEITKALRDCTHTILVASASSVASANVADEISYSLDCTTSEPVRHGRQ